MNKGIYCFTDSKHNNEIVYIGKDSNIDKNRRGKDHLCKSRYNDQPINRVLQNNPNRYNYHVLCKGDCDVEFLNTLERGYIETYTPKFNYSPGGDGRTGARLTDDHKQKISKALKGRIVSKETREKISKANKGNPSPNKGKKFSKETKEKISKSKKGLYTNEKNPRYRHDVPLPEQLYEEWKSGVSQADLKEKYNCGDATIKRRLAKVKKEDGRCNQNIPSNEILFVEWQNGLTQKELSVRYNCSISQIEYKIREYKKQNNITHVKTNHGKHSHKLHSNVPLGEELLKEYNESTITYKGLAEKYGCTTSLINHRIRNARKKMESCLT